MPAPGLVALADPSCAPRWCSGTLILPLAPRSSPVPLHGLAQGLPVATCTLNKGLGVCLDPGKHVADVKQEGPGPSVPSLSLGPISMFQESAPSCASSACPPSPPRPTVNAISRCTRTHSAVGGLERAGLGSLGLYFSPRNLTTTAWPTGVCHNCGFISTTRDILYSHLVTNHMVCQPGSKGEIYSPGAGHPAAKLPSGKQPYWGLTGPLMKWEGRELVHRQYMVSLSTLVLNPFCLPHPT